MGLAPFLAAVALASGCPGAQVHYGVNAQAPTDPAPWIAAGRGATRLVGRLYSPYSESLGDERVREADGLVFYAGRRYKVAWVPRGWSGTAEFLGMEGTRLDGPGSFRSRWRRAISPRFYPSDLTVPSAGCWRITLRTGSARWTLHVRVVEPPSGPRCEPSRVGSGANPVDPGATGPWVAASPPSTGINGGLFVPGIDGAAIYAGGRWPDGANTKILWRTAGIISGLRIWGTRLDGTQSFEQTLARDATPWDIYPSIVNVPVPGCWLLTVRGGGRGGVIVVRALAVS